MEAHAWLKEFHVSITVCDKDGTLLEMNDKSIEMYMEYGGAALLGQNGLDCHPEAARQKMQEMLQTGQGHIYTIRENGVKKLIYQSPWYQKGVFAGIVELALDLPEDLPHRD
jgi:transcriptional regulator with PAS, ATPase and Fis domain